MLNTTIKITETINVFHKINLWEAFSGFWFFCRLEAYWTLGNFSPNTYSYSLMRSNEGIQIYIVDVKQLKLYFTIPDNCGEKSINCTLVVQYRFLFW